MPSDFHNRGPPPLQNFHFFFWKYIFDLATLLTNEHELMPPQGYDLVAPGDKLLYSSAKRKTYR